MNVSCVIPAYNSERWIDDCLKSIRTQRPSNPMETVVVDNSPTDLLRSRVEFHMADWPQLSYVHQGKNGGFAAACNHGFALVHGEWTLFLNADATLLPGAVDALLADAVADARTGAVGPHLEFPDGHFQPQCKRGVPTLWASFCYLWGFDKFLGRMPGFGSYLQQHVGEEEPADVPALSGACMLIRSDVFHSIGMFDTHYFMMFEDLDVCMALKEAGWKIRYCPRARAIHVKGGSTIDAATAVEVGRHFSESWLVFYEKWLSKKYPRIVSAAVHRGMGLGRRVVSR